MPRLTLLYIKTSFVYLVAGLLLGFLQVLPNDLLHQVLAGATAVYYHLLVVGWLTQLIFGVAYWMFPKPSSAPSSRPERLAWATYISLNVGLGLRAVAEPLLTTLPGPTWGSILAVSAGLQWLAALAFIMSIWPRVRGR